MRCYFAEQGRLRGYVFSATRDYHATEDILQEIAIVVATKAPSYQPDGSPLPWFLGIAKNHVRRWYREVGRQSRNISIDLLDECLPAFAGFDAHSISDRQAALRQCLGQLPAGQRQIVDLRYEGGLACEQIAGRVDRSIQSVYALLKRVKAVLRDCVESRIIQEETP